MNKKIVWIVLMLCVAPLCVKAIDPAVQTKLDQGFAKLNAANRQLAETKQLGKENSNRINEVLTHIQGLKPPTQAGMPMPQQGAASMPAQPMYEE